MFRIALILVLLLGGCRRPVAPPAAEPENAPPAKTRAGEEKSAAAPVRTDRSRYVLTNGPHGPEATIVTTLRAPADRAVHLVNCNGATGVNLQRKIGDEWVYARSSGRRKVR